MKSNYERGVFMEEFLLLYCNSLSMTTLRTGVEPGYSSHHGPMKPPASTCRLLDESRCSLDDGRQEKDRRKDQSSEKRENSSSVLYIGIIFVKFISTKR